MNSPRQPGQPHRIDSPQRDFPAARSSASNTARTLIEDMEDDLERARHQGLFGLVRMRYEAWMNERLSTQAQRKMVAKSALVQSRSQQMQAEQGLSQVVHQGHKQEAIQAIESAQIDIVVGRSRAEAIPGLVGNFAPELAAADPPMLPIPSVDMGDGAPIPAPVQIYVDREEIERAAMLLYSEIVSSQDPEATKERSLRELSARYAPLIVGEIYQRACEMGEGVMNARRGSR